MAIAENTDTTNPTPLFSTFVGTGFGLLGISGPDASSFNCTLSAGTLSVFLNAGVVLDYEFQIHYEATVNFSNSTTAPISLDVTDVNEAPQITDTSPFSVQAPILTNLSATKSLLVPHPNG